MRREAERPAPKARRQSKPFQWARVVLQRIGWKGPHYLADSFVGSDNLAHFFLFKALSNLGIRSKIYARPLSQKKMKSTYAAPHPKIFYLQKNEHKWFLHISSMQQHYGPFSLALFSFSLLSAPSSRLGNGYHWNFGRHDASCATCTNNSNMCQARQMLTKVPCCHGCPYPCNQGLSQKSIILGHIPAQRRFVSCHRRLAVQTRSSYTTCVWFRDRQG